jgi:hypothetical protein
MIPIQRKLALGGLTVPVLATDKFPDLLAMADLERKTGGGIKGSLQSVDATDLPKSLTGFRTLWNSFHHFPPDGAREILRNAQQGSQPIAIFEFTERSVPKVLLCFPASFLSVYLLIFRMRPRRVVWWIFTWILPVIPFVIAWDGLISHLRSYTGEELFALIEGLNGTDYTWETGKVQAPRAGLDVSFLMGMPKGNILPKGNTLDDIGCSCDAPGGTN